MRRILYIISLSIILFVSCSKSDENIVITKDFQNEEWSRFEYLTGDIEINKAPSNYDIVMEIKVSEVFPNIYENHRDEASLPFNMTIKNPDGNGSRSRDYKFTLKDREGNWKADKKEGYYVFQLPVINEITLTEEGIYNFKIENKYPKDPLYGIKSLTLKCINIK